MKTMRLRRTEGRGVLRAVVAAVRGRCSWGVCHKWGGAALAVFLLVFCVSGIVLNHRRAVAGLEVSRRWLPEAYHIRDYNNGIVRGTATAGDSVLAYGCGGVWLTDRNAVRWEPMNEGLPDGADRRGVRNLVRTKGGVLWCATNYDAYSYRKGEWRAAHLPCGGERITDIALSPDGGGVVVLSRSAVYKITPDGEIRRKELPAAAGRTPEETLFRVVWKLHSGEFFGLPGRIAVDCVAVALTILSVTGIALFVLPYRIRRNNRRGGNERAEALAGRMRRNLRLHNRIGAATVVFTLFVTGTGTCLRPPLMLPLALTRVAATDTKDNAWHDRLRAIRWDETARRWLLSTSDGFISLDSAMAEAPTPLSKDATPPVSPMGVNVFRRTADGSWLVGSFSGLYRWSPSDGEVADYFTGEKPAATHNPFNISAAVSGYSADFSAPAPVVFYYAAAAKGMPAQPEILARTPLSLWSAALELHTGRCYQPFIGPLSSLFVFIWGAASVLVILSGHIVRRRQKKRRASPWAGERAIS